MHREILDVKDPLELLDHLDPTVNKGRREPQELWACKDQEEILEKWVLQGSQDQVVESVFQAVKDSRDLADLQELQVPVVHLDQQVSLEAKVLETQDLLAPLDLWE